MKKLLILLAFFASLSISASAQSIPPTKWVELDGSPSITPPKKVVVPNGSISGSTVTLTGGGGGGCTPPGTLGRILYDDGAGGCLSITGATTNGTFVTLTTPVLGVATGTSLTLTGNVQVGIAALYKFGGSNSFSYTDSVGPKWTDGNTVRDLIFNVQSLTANRTVTWPDASGTVAFTSGVPAGANPTASVGLSAVNGVATTFMRSDGAPALDQGITPTWTGAHIFTNTIALTSTTAANNKITQGAAINIGTTSTDGIILQNTTAAAAGAQQYSPRLRLTGFGWKTNATAASQQVDWIMEVQPVQGAAAPTANLLISGQINGGGFNQAIAAGQILGPGGASGSQSLPQYSAVNNSTYGLRIGAGSAGNAVSLVAANTYLTADANANMVVLKSNAGLSWGNADNTTSRQVHLYSPANDILQVRDNGGSTVGGNIIIGGSGSSLPTSAKSTLVVQNGTAPASSPADQFTLYSADSAAGDANAFARNEAGEINRLTGLAARNSSSFAKTSDTTLANITGLTRNVEAGRAYAFETEISTTSANTGGVKFAISGTATATSIDYEGILFEGTAISAKTRATALDTTVCAVTAVTAATCKIRGVIVVNAGGTLTVQFAQNASDGGASTVLVNQALCLQPIS